MNIGKILQLLWQRSVAPSPHIIEKDQRRQAALLSAFLLGLTVIALTTEFAYNFLTSATGKASYSEIFIAIFLLLILYLPDTPGWRA